MLSLRIGCAAYLTAAGALASGCTHDCPPRTPAPPPGESEPIRVFEPPTSELEAPSCELPPWPPEMTEDEGYLRFELCGWTVYMSEALYADESRAASTYAALAYDLGMVASLLPPTAVEFLRATNFWMELDLSFEYEDALSGVYHPEGDYLCEQGLPLKWARGIHFGVADEYLYDAVCQPAMVLHELAHAWHHQRHHEDHAQLREAYQAAKDTRLYEGLENRECACPGSYAMKNEFEYFAELSEAYFSTGEPPRGWFNEYYPFTHEQLQVHDPAGFAAVEAAWGLR